MTDLFSVSGKTAVVTGGTRGIGIEMARGLLDAGARVIIASRKADAVESAGQELSAHGDVHAVQADLSNAEGVERLAAATRKRFDGKLNILINNAGVSWGEPLEEYPESAWERVLGTNVRGVFLLTQALLPELRASASARDPARVVMIGSVDGIRPPMLESYAYSASKAAVHQLTRHLAKRLAGEAICVNAIAPGPFESKMTAFMLEDEELRGTVVSGIPLGRIGTPEDLVGTTLFLASRAGAYLTGTVIPLDGGYTGCG